MGQGLWGMLPLKNRQRNRWKKTHYFQTPKVMFKTLKKETYSKPCGMAQKTLRGPCSTGQLYKLPETNVALDRKPSQNETSLPTYHFSVANVSFREGTVLNIWICPFLSHLFSMILSITNEGLFAVLGKKKHWKSTPSRVELPIFRANDASSSIFRKKS